MLVSSVPDPWKLDLRSPRFDGAAEEQLEGDVVGVPEEVGDTALEFGLVDVPVELDS
jgi:hypothetical protein